MKRDFMVYRTFKIPSISGERTAMCEWDGPHDRGIAEQKARQLAIADPGTRFLVFPYPPTFEAIKPNSLVEVAETSR